MRIGISLLMLAGLAFARDEQTKNFEKTVALGKGGAVRVEHSMGGVYIRTQPRNDVTVRATIRCSADTAEEAKKCVDTIQVMVQEAGGSVSVRTQYPEEERSSWFWRRGRSFSVNYDIVMPETAPLDLRNRFGEVNVAGLGAPSIIRNANGRVSFSSGKGAQRIENSFGPVEVLRNEGDVVVEGANGAVTVENVTGLAEVRNRFGKVVVARATKGATVRNNNGEVEVTNSGGATNVTNSFGAVRVVDAKGQLLVENQNGPVEVRGVTGTADLRTSFSKVTATGVGGSVSVRASNGTVVVEDVGGSSVVENSFGAIEVRSVKGDARVKGANSSVRLLGVGGEVSAGTTFGGVTVEDAGGPVTVENQNGSVTVVAKPAKGCHPLILRTSFGPIRVTVPDGAGYTVAAKTSFGKICSEPEVAVSGAVPDGTLNGKIGAGGCEMRLTNANGSIDILKGMKR
ncbi:MAG: hypothetical protein SFV54_27440 [Bryobacteraceae bacterium]|nr:hypothetical protein [Bryobacteraceae bacterium]